MRVAVLTISDKGANGERKDETGRILKEFLKESSYEVSYYKVIPDERECIEEELVYICDKLKISLIITNGGTGFSKRDVTPEATKAVIEKEVPGIGEVMRFKSMEITPRAMLSRGIAGIRGESLIINLPGSPKGAIENLSFVIDGIGHGLEILLGETVECGRS